MHIVVVLDPIRGEIREFSLGAIKQKVRAIWKKKKKLEFSIIFWGFPIFWGANVKKVKIFITLGGVFKIYFILLQGNGLLQSLIPSCV